MKAPTIYTPEQIRSDITMDVSCGLPNGRYVMARPEGWGGVGLCFRLKCAWLVFTGRADVLQWVGQP